jgi:NADPH:quinone reductase-like Zn-dependent oxidoreductase
MWVYQYRDRIALESLERTEWPDPDPGPHDVVIQMSAVALNHRDIALARGHYHIDAQPPLVPLSDGAGHVVAIGREVTRFRIGDLAAPVYLPDWIDGPVTPHSGIRRLGGPTDGVLLEFKCVHEAEAVRLPSFLSAAEGATLPITAVTAWHALNVTGTLKSSDTVFIQGTGALSLAALQVAKMAGTRTILLTRDNRFSPRLRELGADIVITTEQEPDWPQAVVKATDGNGADVLVDILGGDSLNRTIRAARVGGCIHAAGYVTGTSATIDLFEAIRHAVTIHVATAGHRASFESLARALDQHQLHPVVGDQYSIDEIPDAFEAMARGGHFGKIVIQLTRPKALEKK